MTKHNCDNDICRLLNPCLDELLPYQEVIGRVAQIEESLYANVRKMKKMKKMERMEIAERLHISHPLDLWSWANHHMVYQLPNKEFIHGLTEKIKEIGADTILEIGAGRGIVSKRISEILNKKIVLTDSYEWWEHWEYAEKIEHPDVIKRNYVQAIEEFKPDLIIASWIPYDKCWTRDFRKYPFVKGYIIIGEGRGGATGSEEDWNTDWNMQYWDNVTKYGICKTDHGFSMKDPILQVLHTDVTYFERPKT